MTSRSGGEAGPTSTTIADRDLEYGILVFYGMRDLADGLFRDASALSKRMERRAKRSARRRFGAATSFGAPLAGFQFLLVLVGATVLIGVNALSVQFDREHRLDQLRPDTPSLIAAAAIALGLVGMLVAVGRRVVDRSVSAVAARAALVYVAGCGAVLVACASGLATPVTAVAVTTVTVLSVAVAVWFGANRRRRPAAAAAVDAAWSQAVAEQLPTFEHEREVLRQRLLAGFAARDDAAVIVADRNSVRAPADADALPGETIIRVQSSLWLTSGRHARRGGMAV